MTRPTPIPKQPHPSRPALRDRLWDFVSSPVVLTIALGTAGVLLFLFLRAPMPPEAVSQGPHLVKAVTADGALRLENGAEIRLLGVEPVPQTRPALEEHVVGRSVLLRFDRERKDPAGRFLAYVYVEGDSLNERLVRDGLARADRDARIEPRQKGKLLDSERQAREERRGVWADR